MSTEIKAHIKYNDADYKALQEKGYSNQEIVKIWDDDIERDITKYLYWIDACRPEKTPEIIEQFLANKSNNPYIES